MQELDEGSCIIRITRGRNTEKQEGGFEMTIAEMKERKRELGLSNKSLAEKSGVPLGTVQKIFSGETASPREDTIRALERVLRRGGGESYSYGLNVKEEGISGAGILKEEGATYHYERKQAEKYTLEDYLALPDEKRVELIDGVFYDMLTPTTGHQAVAGDIYTQLKNYVKNNKGDCLPLISPVDVQLDADDKTVVQPDVVIVCDRDKFRNGRVFGAPDFVAEVLSPSTKDKDMYLKSFKYKNAGVREYWMIDTKLRKVVVYDFEHEEIPAVYGEDLPVPVLIWDAKCEVDFAEIYRQVGFLFE